MLLGSTFFFRMARGDDIEATAAARAGSRPGLSENIKRMNGV